MLIILVVIIQKTRFILLLVLLIVTISLLLVVSVLNKNKEDASTYLDKLNINTDNPQQAGKNINP